MLTNRISATDAFAHTNADVVLTESLDSVTLSAVSPALRRPGVPPVDSDNDDDGGDPAGEKCGQVLAALSAYLDGELDNEDDETITAHLRHCSDCSEAYNAIQAADRIVEREWRDDAPLPSPFEKQKRLDAIMDALPPAIQTEPDFAPRRVHARARWMRFATGAAMITLLFLLLGSSYSLGYRQGQRAATAGTPSATLASTLFLPAPSPPSPLVSTHKIRPRQW